MGKVYEEIRALQNDIPVIARNTGLPEFKIKRIKEHLFFDEHILRDGSVSKFHPDPEVASVWDRLYKGDFVENDLQLLEHEYFESKFERIFKTDYDTAHNAAQDLHKGRAWNPNK